MDIAPIDPVQLRQMLESMDNLPNDFNPEAEAFHLMSIFSNELPEVMKDYTDIRPEGAGGSGIVISAVFSPFGVRRAIKVPRERLYKLPPQTDDVVDVDPELHALSKVSHENITRLYDSYPLKRGNGHCVITEYVENPAPLDAFAHRLCCSPECRQSKAARSKAMKDLAAAIYEIVGALVYMYETAHLLHFDLKPDNILVSSSGKPFVTDLGFARDKTKYQPGQMVKVGFTWKYAHPRLTDPHFGARVSQNPAKSKNLIPSEELLPTIDLFAFGRTIQEVLKRLEDEYKEIIHSEYTFNYLHLIACLCLDGKNGANQNGSRQHFVSDQALGMPLDIFRRNSYSSFHDPRIAIERLLGRRRLEDDLPETDQWAASTINVSDLGITTLTPRARAIINHPTVQRLSGELQLGMLDTVFPTATHTRLQHTLGVFHAACGYITALYYDPENPTFRALFSERECRKALLASLVHDIGQTTFGHELEEVDKREFSHEAIGRLVLTQDTAVDEQGRTLREIIEGTDEHCWALTIESVIELLQSRADSPIDGVLHDILDGQLDADKLDYLIRDSVETRVRYGHGIDHERFLRSLTTCSVSTGQRSSLRLAIKRKGAASAEAFAFARYQLYQSLYWHHTFRAIKAMLLAAASGTFRGLRSRAKVQELFNQYPLRTAYLNFVLGIRPKSEAETEARTVVDRRRPQHSRDEFSISDLIEQELRRPPQFGAAGKYSEDKTIDFLYRLSEGKNKIILDDLIQRRYYKRVIEIPLSDWREGGWVDLRDLLRGDNRADLQNRIETSLLNTLRSAIQDQIKFRQSLVEDQTLSTVERICAQRHAFLIDLPLRGWTASGDEPIFVSDYKRRHFRAGAGAFDQLERSTLWSEHLAPMMRRIAVFRVYCEPELLDIIRKVMDTPSILTAVTGELPELPTLNR